MSVYVDDMRAKFGRMVMCHMIADSTEELLAMARSIGLQAKWIQHPGTHKEHFDVNLAKRAEAVRAGAKEITWMELGRLVHERRAMAAMGGPENHKGSPLAIAAPLAGSVTPKGQATRKPKENNE